MSFTGETLGFWAIFLGIFSDHACSGYFGHHLFWRWFMGIPKPGPLLCWSFGDRWEGQVWDLTDCGVSGQPLPFCILQFGNSYLMECVCVCFVDGLTPQNMFDNQQHQQDFLDSGWWKTACFGSHRGSPAVVLRHLRTTKECSLWEYPLWL